jgi:NADH:ubiquinone oxidoreductase subunit F (NADH-binding)
MTELSLGALRRIEPRLLQPAREAREGREEYEAAGGYAENGLRGRALIDAVESAGLRGHGGAAFPTGVKLRTVADRDGPRYLIANGEEGEPASIKDRWLLRYRPHLVLDGILRAAEAIDAAKAYVYVSDAAAADSVILALGELGGDTAVPLELITVEPTYVAGEETSAVRYIMGGPAKPTDKPPRPFEAGVEGRPTLVANVETLANLPGIARGGAAEFREVGTERSPGTFLFTVSGAVERPGLYELPLGVPLQEAVEELAVYAGAPRGYLMGGFFAGLLTPRAGMIHLAYDDLRDEGSGLGCGAVIVLGADDCPVAAAGDVMSYFARENAHQCGACFRGTAAMRDVLFALGTGEADEAGIERLRGWSVSLRGRGACATIDGAAHLAATLLREFPDDVEEHLAAPCPRCAALLSTDPERETRFAVNVDSLKKGVPS